MMGKSDDQVALCLCKKGVYFRLHFIAEEVRI